MLVVNTVDKTISNSLSSDLFIAVFLVSNLIIIAEHLGFLA